MDRLIDYQERYYITTEESVWNWVDLKVKG